MTTPGIPLRLGAGRYQGITVSSDQRLIINASVREGLSGTATNARLTAAGIGLRRQATLAVIREIKGLERRIPAVRSIPNRFRAGLSSITPTNVNIAGRFRIKALINATNRITGEVDRIYINFGTNENLTAGEMKQRAQDIFEKGQRTSESAEYGGARRELVSLNISSIEEAVG